MENNPESEPLRQLVVDFNFVLAAPATALAPNYSSPAVPFGPSAWWRGGTHCMGNSLSSVSHRPGLHLSTPSPTHLHPYHTV